MLKQMICALFIGPLLLVSGFLSADQSMPNEFTVTERWLSWTTTFDIATKDRILGTVHRKFFSLTPEYHLTDTQENLLSKARMRFFSLMAVFDIEDQYQRPLGSVNREFTFFFPTYKIISPDGRILGEAVLNFWGTEFTISAFDGHPIATLTRPFFRLKSNWTVKIIDQEAISENNIHPHLFLTLLAFQVDKEYWEAQRRRMQQQINENRRQVEHASKKNFSAKNQNSDEAIDSEGAMVNEFRAQLQVFRSEVENIQPTAEDFKAIESMSIGIDASADQPEKNRQALSHMTNLFSLLSSDELSQQRKAALYLMLENVLDVKTEQEQLHLSD